jgi:hypothetical protein
VTHDDVVREVATRFGARHEDAQDFVAMVRAKHPSLSPHDVLAVVLRLGTPEGAEAWRAKRPT